MKKFLLLASAVVLSLSAMAQAEVDVQIARLIREAKAKQFATTTHARLAPATADSIRVVAQIDAEAVERFMARSDGYDFARITAYAGGVAVVKILPDDIERLQHTKGVTSIEHAHGVSLDMDKGRPYTGVDLAQAGTGMPDGKGFDGTGVTVVIVDSGFDINHPAFRDKDGNTRIKLLALRDEEGNFYEVSDPDQIATLTTDVDFNSHASHVTSIAAGTDVGNGYGGVAPGADIVFVQVYQKDLPPVSEGMENRSVTDIAWTLEAAQKAHDIVKRLGTPSVVNMSLGNHVGARDGSDLPSKFINALTQDAIYCISAANAGKQNACVHHTFTADSEKATICLQDYSNIGMQFFADSNKPFTLTLQGYMQHEEPFVIATLSGEGSVTIDSKDTDNPLVQRLREILFSDEFRMEMRSGIYYNGNYHVDVFTTDMGISARYENLQILITADKDTHIDGFIYESNGKFFCNGEPGEMTHSNDGSISTLVVGTGAIVSGAMAARATAPKPDGTEVDDSHIGTQPGDVAPFSSFISYGDYLPLPHILSPGYNVVAAGNLYHKNREKTYTTSQLPVVFGRESPYVIASGTSMSSPYTTGVVALWLQANPDLTRDDILAIMKKTAKTNDYMAASEEPARWGWGIIDAYNGAKEALALPAAISDTTREPANMVKVVGNTIEITVEADRHCRATLYNAAGTTLATTTGTTIDISSLPRGIYFVSLNDGKSIKIKK